MKTTATLIVAAALALAGASSFAAGTPCETLKDKLTKHLDGKHVTGYTLEVVDADKVEEAKAGGAKVIGSCEGGTKKITYARKK